ncbi:hypothetical protein CL629_00785 [bacterium]|nr:hypothetical protein [bacterium]|tara:strand:- start:1422 stop:2399 length:978 start_codon:yes stop_codon:yes gene_type:complete
MIGTFIFWIVVFIAAFYVLLRGSDYLIENAEAIGINFGLSPFIIGVLIIGIGTSIPELAASFVAIFSGATEIVTANAVGSNIANILIVLGITAVITHNIQVEKNLIYLDLPLLLITTILFIGVVIGKEMLANGTEEFIINRGEAIFLIAVYLIYAAYSLFYQDSYIEKIKSLLDRPQVDWRNWALLFGGVFGVVIGAKLVVDATLALSGMLNIGVGIISIVAIALGTSLPELSVSLKAARAGKPELAIGNIFGSSVFNILMLVGLPGIFTTLIIEESVVFIGIPVLLAATLIFVISGISNKVHRWDGAMYIMLYILFLAKLFGLF